MIPYQLFEKFDQVLDKHILALERVQISQGVAQGYLTARQGKDSKVRASNRSLVRKAYPEEKLIIES